MTYRSGGHSPVPMTLCYMYPRSHTQILKYNNSGDTWVENSPYHSPDVTKLVRPVQEQAKPEPVMEKVEVKETEGELESGVPFIPVPPPLPPILPPVVEDEEEEEEEEGEEEVKKIEQDIEKQQVSAFIWC